MLVKIVFGKAFLLDLSSCNVLFRDEVRCDVIKVFVCIGGTGAGSSQWHVYGFSVKNTPQAWRCKLGSEIQILNKNLL